VSPTDPHTNPADDIDYAAAFRAVSGAVDTLKACGLEGADLWRCLFSAANDLRSADMQGDPDAYRAELEAHRDALNEAIREFGE
jgi:hypothetical protein